MKVVVGVTLVVLLAAVIFSPTVQQKLQSLFLLHSSSSEDDPSATVIKAGVLSSSAPECNYSASWLLQPVPPLDYFQRFHSRKVLHITQRGDRFYAPLQSDLAAVESLLATQARENTRPELMHPTLNETQAGCMFVKESMVDRKKDYKDAFHAYLDGCTLVCHMVPAYWPPLARLMLGLADETGLEYMANMYLTPRGSQGFIEHTDNTDGLIVQADGAKKWVISGTKFPLPGRTQTVGRPWQAPASSIMGPTVFNDTLRKGELLLVPRGFIHYAQAAGQQPSLHYTVSPIKPVSWEQLLPALFHAADKDVQGLNGRALAGFVAQVAAQVEGSWLREDAAPYAQRLRLSGSSPEDLELDAAANQQILLPQPIAAARQHFAGSQLQDKLQLFRQAWSQSSTVSPQRKAAGLKILDAIDGLSVAQRLHALESAFTAADVFREYTRRVNTQGRDVAAAKVPSLLMARTDLEAEVEVDHNRGVLKLLVEDEPMANFRHTPQSLSVFRSFLVLKAGEQRLCGTVKVEPLDVFEQICICRILQRYQVLRPADA